MALLSPNYFSQGMDAFDAQTQRLNQFAAKNASQQAGAAIAGGDYQGGSDVLNRAGMLSDAHNVLADQTALADRKTAEQNLAADRAQKAKAIQIEGLSKITDALQAIPEGQRANWLKQQVPLIQGLGIPTDSFANMSEDQLSDAALGPWKAMLGNAKLTIQKQGEDIVGVDSSGKERTRIKGNLILKKDENIYAPDARGSVGPGSPDAATGAGTLPAAPPSSAQPTTPANVSPQDRDALARMMVTEAGGEGPQGMAAVAHVALNRLNSGYGGARTLSDVVNQPGQFEGMSRAASVHPQDLARAQAVANQVLSGQLADPTNGADHFLNPTLQTQLGRTQPAWADGSGQRIGNHVFYGGKKGAGPAQAVAAINAPQGDGTLTGSDAGDTAPTGYHLLAAGPHDPEDAPLTKEAVTMGATQIAMTGKVPALGMGKAARNDRKAMLDEAAQLIKQWNISPEDWVTGVAQFKVAQGSLAKVSQIKNLVQASENAVVANMNQVVMPLMTKVQPGGIPFLNKYILAVRDKAFGDPDVKAYDNALHNVADEYAKVMTTTTGSGGTGLSDSARNEAYRRLSTAQTGPQLQETFKALQSEMANRRVALEQQETALTGQLRNGLAPPGQPAPGAPQAAPAAPAPPANRPPLASFQRR